MPVRVIPIRVPTEQIRTLAEGTQLALVTRIMDLAPGEVVEASDGSGRMVGVSVRHVLRQDPGEDGIAWGHQVVSVVPIYVGGPDGSPRVDRFFDGQW